MMRRMVADIASRHERRALRRVGAAIRAVVLADDGTKHPMRPRLRRW